MTTPTASPTIDLTPLHGSFPGQVLQRLQEMVDPLVLVGGSVRDLLLGRELRDLDIATPAGALDLARRLANAMHGAYVPLDEPRDTGRAVLTGPDGQTLVVDFAAWRGPSLADDLRLRDFTVNALAAEVDGNSAALIDAAGGLPDLDARQLRMASPTALRDDPLRCLRAVRLLAELSPWGFRLEQDTARQIGRHASLVVNSAGERVRDELVRIVAAAEPERSLAVLDELGLLAVVLPEAAALHGVAQSEPHVYDVFEHTVRVVEHTARLADWIAGRVAPQPRSSPIDEETGAALAPFRAALAGHMAEPVGVALGSRGNALRWAALCHDWGKPATRTVEIDPDDGRERVRFFGHEDESARLTQTALRRLRFSEAEVRWVSTIVAGHMRPHHLVAAGQPSRRAVYRYFRELGAAGVNTALLSLADLQAMDGPGLRLETWQRQLDGVAHLLDAYFNQPQQAVRPAPLLDGNELMAALRLRPGRTVGLLLEAIAEAQATGDVQDRGQALAFAAQIIDATSED